MLARTSWPPPPPSRSAAASAPPRTPRPSSPDRYPPPRTTTNLRTLEENDTNLPACLLEKSINFKTKAIMKHEKRRQKRIFKISKMLPFKPKELNKKTFNFKPPLSHIIIDIRTKKTLDSLEAKNRTNIIARSPAKVKLFKLKLDKAFIETSYGAGIIDIRTKKTLDSLKAKTRRLAKASYTKLLNASSPDSYPPPPTPSPPSPPPSPIRTPPLNELLQLSPSCLHNS